MGSVGKQELKCIDTLRGTEIESFVNHIKTPIPVSPENGERWYIASPFSSNHPEETERWLNEITHIVGGLEERYSSVAIFSPIVSTSQIAFAGYRPAAGWYNKCLKHLDGYDRLIIAGQKNWQNSSGIAIEIGFAVAKKIPVSFLEIPEGQSGTLGPQCDVVGSLPGMDVKIDSQSVTMKGKPDSAPNEEKE